MTEHFSLFSLSKISINDLLLLSEKKHENRIKNTKFFREKSNSEDIFNEDLKKKIEKNKICLGLGADGNILSNSPVFCNKLSSNENRRSLYTKVATSNENININQIKNSIVSEQKLKMNDSIIGTNNLHDLTCEMKTRDNRFITRKNLTDTKVIWDSIQENIKNIVSSNE